MTPLLTSLKRRGWRIECRNSSEPLLSGELASLLPELPTELVELLSGVDVCQNAAENAWLLTARDYNRNHPGAFRWNEYKHMALETADSPEAAKEIEDFWACHFPFALAVHSDYDYLAVSLRGAGRRPVVHGFAPFWDEPAVIAPSFRTFLTRYSRAAVAKKPAYPYSLFL